MVFKRMLQSLGVGGPSVDTVLANPRVRPGEPLTGEVRIEGGDHEVDIDYIALGMVARIEMESGDSEYSGTTEFFRADVAGSFRLGAGERRAVPFAVPVPWETPISEVYGNPLRGMVLGLRTELAVAKAVDKSDLDQFSVAPLPSQEAVLNGFGQLGFRFRSADLEMGRLARVHQRLPFFQEIEFYPPPSHSGRINEVELTFVAGRDQLDVILEADKRGGLFTSGHDAFGRFTMSHQQAEHTDWTGEIGRWLDALSKRRPGGHHGHHGHRGHGAGGALAAGIAGAVGGFVAAEAIDEIGDFFEGE
jgi:sporulation-control protein